MSVHTDGEYFVQEDTGKHLVRELVNFKFRVHELIPKRLREQVFSELDATVSTSLTSALNFELLDEYDKMNDLYSQFAKEADVDTNKEILE